MPITPERISRLREFGLSEYAARAYLALLDLGLTEARDVSNLSRVPQAKVYQVLDQLHDKGLAIILPEFPKKYAPVPFEEFLDRIHRQHLDAAHTIDKTRRDLTTLFSVTGNVDVGDRGDFTVIRSRRNVLEKLVEICGRAQNDLVLIGTRGLASRASYIFDKTAAAHERGATLRILLPVDRENVVALERLAARGGLRARDAGDGSASDNVAIVIADGRHALLIHFVPDDGDLTTGRDVAVFTDQEAMVGAIQAMAGPLWDHAETFAARQDQLETGREPGFTHIYASAEDAMEALAASLARCENEYLTLNPDTAGIPIEHSLATVPRVCAAGGRVRAVLETDDAESVERFSRVMAVAPTAEARHVDPPAPMHFWLVDQREAFLAVSRAHSADDARITLVVHTNNPAFVQALREQFEETWARGVPYAERIQDVERYPDLHPREVGVGKLFAALQEAVLLYDADGRIRAWNASAQALLGYTAKEACGRTLAEVFPHLTRDHLHARFHAAKPDSDVFAASMDHKDGALLDVEATVGILGETGDVRFAVLRAAQPTRASRTVRIRGEPGSAKLEP